MKKFLKENSNCVQGLAESCGKLSPGLATEEQCSCCLETSCACSHEASMTGLPVQDFQKRQSNPPLDIICSIEVERYYAPSTVADYIEAKLDKIADFVNLNPQGMDLVTESITSLYSKLRNVQHVTLPENSLYHMEGFGILITGLMNSTNMYDASAHVLSYARSVTSTSIVESVRSLLAKNINVFEEQAFGTDDWINLLRGARQNWKLILNNVHYENFRNLLSILVSLNMCDSSCVEFSIYGMKLFSEKLKPRQHTAIDLVDAVITAVTSFGEGLFECFRVKNFMPLMYGDVEAVRLNEECELCERLMTFATTGDLDKSGENITQPEFICKLESCIDKIKSMLLTAKGQVTINMLNLKLDKLTKAKNNFDRICNKSGLRDAPWQLLVYGDSGVGKSSVANILMVMSLLQNDYPAGDMYLIYDNEFDEYDSTLKSFVTGIFFDDVCNTKSDFQKSTPVAPILRVNNNARNYGNMAEAAEKGKVLKEPKVSVLTSNTKNLESNKYSNNALSIERRNNCIITVKVLPKFADENGMLDQQKVKDYYVGEMQMDKIPVVPEIWSFTVEKACGKVKKGKVSQKDIVYIPFVYEGKKMVNVNFETLLKFNRDMSKAHFEAQKVLVENQTNLAEKINMCNVCKMPVAGINMCQCMDHQFGYSIAKSLYSRFTLYNTKRKTLWDKYADRIESKLLGEMEERLYYLEHSPYARWTNWIPEKWLEDTSIRQLILYTHYDEITSTIRRAYVNYILILLLCITLSSYDNRFIMAMLPIFCWALRQLAAVIETEKDRLMVRICEENKSMDVIFRKYRDDMIGYITAGSLVLGSIYTVACVWKHLRNIHWEPQGELSPKTIEDVKERDSEAELEQTIAKEQGWVSPNFAPIPCSEAAKTITNEQLVNKTWTNLTQFSVELNGTDNGCDMFFMEANLAVVPRHIWKREEFLATIARGTNSIQKFQSYLSRHHSEDLEGTDLSVVYIPNAGSWSDMTRYLPVEKYESGRNIPVTCIYKEMRGSHPERKECQTVANFSDEICVKDVKYHGAKYELAWQTFNGLCMAPLITNTKETMIVGFHTAGVAGTTTGAMCSITRDAYLKARQKLLAKRAVCVTASKGTMRTELYGKEMFKEKNLHPKSPLHAIPEESHLDVYGSCVGASTYYSEVIPTPIAKDVQEICGFNTKYGPPAFHLRNAWKKSIEVSSNPSVGVEPSLLMKATTDYTDHLVEQFHVIPELAPLVRPLNDLENINGIPGCRFINHMPPNTSVGLPEGGPKSLRLTPINNLHEYMREMGYEDEEIFKLYEKNKYMVKLDEKYLREMRRMENEYRNGRRCHSIFKACLKDEVTKSSKEKVRVFQAAPIALQLCIRKYFLPIVRLLSLFPLDSECGVGINTMGPEFGKLIEFMKQYGDERILAGDYSKYDLRMPAQLILAAFDVLIRIAESFGYSEGDLKIMRGIASDIAYPVMAYNGDLVQHFGSNPSGQNLTVYINSIVNSLLLRSAYFKIYEGEELPPFREVAAMMTYGDDVKGSVKEGYEKFNHISYAEFLSDHDIIFTMPDKTSTPTMYMHHKDADFLKRKDVYNDRFKIWQGAIDEESLFKSLVAIKKSKSVAPMEQVMMNIDGALREWYLHGEEKYELRRAQMRDIAQKHHIAGGCMMLNKSYQDCHDDYARRYHLVCE